jgi:molecular chaperone GrpE
MWSVLESEGVQPIAAVGKPFDPSVHEAVSVDSDGGDTVVEEFQRGYKLHDRVIRPAMVKVGQAKPSEQTSEA